MLASMTLVPLSFVQAEETESVVQSGKTVSFEYTMSLDDGSIVESNVGAEPIEYIHGQSQLFPRLEEALTGLTVDDEKSIILEPADAFGQTSSEAFQEIPTEEIPEEAREVGAQVAVAGLDWPVLVHEVRRDSVVLNLNHPLAGKALTFDVRILSIS
jgi:FKBP-type peptidyl-prolyl cis-trans isomerase 2